MPVRRPVCLICLIFLLFVYIYSADRPPAPSWDVDAASKKTVSVTGTVSDRQEKNGTFQIYLKDVSFTSSDQTYFPNRSKGIIVRLDANAAGREYARLGAIIRASGTFEPFEVSRCEGMFDARCYYSIRGYDGQLKRAKITTVLKKYNLFTERLRCIRDRAYDILLDNMSGDDAGLVAAMTLGDKTGLDTGVKELYQNAGISHVLALSGLHIASVGLALLAILKRMHLPSCVALSVSFVFIALYAVMTGMSTSTVRAMIMFGLFILSGIAGRTYDILTAAAVSAVLILIVNPLYIYDTGFLLSFGAILGIVFIYPALCSLVIKKNDTSGSPIASFAKKIAQSMCISISVTIATLPVTGKSFMQISLCSVFVNLLVIPLMSVLLFTGFLGIITGFIGIKPNVILKIPHYILLIYRALGETSEKIDGNTFVIGTPDTWQIITYAIIVVIVVMMRNITCHGFGINNGAAKSVDPSGRRDFKNNKRNSKICNNKITYIVQKSSDQKKERRKNLAKAIITIVMIAVAVAVMAYHPRSDLEIRNVDVGQGDCALIWGKDVPVIMIDGGSSDIKNVGKYRIIPVLKSNGVTTVDYCFISHMDSDHVNGVIQMLEDDRSPINIRNIIVSDTVLAKTEKDFSGDGMDNLEKLMGAAEARKVNVRGMSAGDTLESGKFIIRIVSPGEGGIVSSGGSVSSTDENDCSLVIELRLMRKGDVPGFSALFTGDISENTERGILYKLGECNYLKVAHHGSRFSSSADFLTRTRPEISVISAGVNNSYGHPHRETIERLNESGSRIYNTAKYGETILTVTADKVSVRSMLR